MNDLPYSARVIALARDQGLLRSRDLDAQRIPRVVLARLTARGQLEQIGRGLYQLPDADPVGDPGLATVAVKSPNCVFCLLTALRLHGITTQSPREVWIALPQGSHAPRLAYPPVRMIQVSAAYALAGIETLYDGAVPLRVSGVARTVVDCFKHRSKVGLDVALEALKEALSRNTVSADELWHVARICRVTSVLRPYLEALL
jgi:predicted transcriptional regulator of viral defense system